MEKEQNQNQPVEDQDDQQQQIVEEQPAAMKNQQEVKKDAQMMPEESEEDVEYVDEDMLENMDLQPEQMPEESDDDFKTMKESELGDEDQMMFGEGEIIAENELIQDDSACQLALVHQDHVYCVTQVPKAPFNTFISGDGNDKCYIWSIKPRAKEEIKSGEDKKFECVKVGELAGHTETVEFVQFSFDGKLCLTGGMNNVLRIWQTDAENPQVFKEKCKFENGPAESDDILFVDWHPKGNAVLCGGKDYMIWLMNGATGDFLACLSGHEAEVLAAKFTIANGGKQIISSSADSSIRVWSPANQKCLHVIKKSKAIQDFHTAGINVFALHHEQPLVVSGDLDGVVCYSNYQTGETGGTLGKHDDSVESIAFCKSAPYCVSVGMNPVINIYNVKDSKLRQQVAFGDFGGFNKVVFSELEPHFFYISSTLGHVTLIDVRNGDVQRTYRGHAAPINDFLEVKEHKLLVTAGDDFVCNVYDLSKEPKSQPEKGKEQIKATKIQKGEEQKQ